ncbi:SIS domain-containing protein [Vagococcus salmoninarum]|uniref:SIS domain-containing protein n=1 Tax=Vagococcus salmoninarum TaxID=2739 RepID=UPI001882DA45|nr:SIS domain-containing protein [Vagococcus salmoninarum]MBE9389341.1 SIS domain-containing protein [Vagococcus salmoninarum]
MNNQTYKEIFLQSESLARINEELAIIVAELEKVFPEKAASYEKVIFTGCGTSLYLAQSAAHFFMDYTGVEAVAVPCSELYFFTELNLGSQKVLVVPITRKSHTTEVRMAIDKVRSFKNVKTLAITCDPASEAYNDFMIVASETAEKSVVMTRSYTSMLYLSLITALFVGGEMAELDKLKDINLLCHSLLIEMDEMAKKIISENQNLDLYITLGQGEFYGVANECMNKMKEMGLVNSEAYHSLEYRHGPMSIANQKTLILTLAHSKCTEYDDKLLQQLKGFGCTTVAIGKNVKSMTADYTLATPKELSDSQLSIFLGILGQLLGIYIADNKGLDPDKPQNLTQAIVL